MKISNTTFLNTGIFNPHAQQIRDLRNKTKSNELAEVLDLMEKLSDKVAKLEKRISKYEGGAA